MNDRCKRMRMLCPVIGLAGLLVAGSAPVRAAVIYNLTAPPGTTVKYEAKESLSNFDSMFSIVRSIGTNSAPTFGLLSDAATLTLSGSGAAWDSPVTDPHGILGANNFVTPGGGANKSALDLTFNSPSGFAGGSLRVNYAIYNNLPSLWDIDVDYLAWQVSTDGGANFTDIFRQYTVDTEPAGTKRYDSGVLTIPGINGAGSIVIRGIIDTSGGTMTTSGNTHWYLLATPPFTTGSFPGGLEINLQILPEPSTVLLLALGGLLLRRCRRRG